eukprot:6500448-Alexandrium_andersonii.AAC.1
MAPWGSWPALPRGARPSSGAAPCLPVWGTLPPACCALSLDPSPMLPASRGRPSAPARRSTPAWA